MHDPMIVAFEVRLPFGGRRNSFDGEIMRPLIATIWHVDPQVGGDEDSCDWFGSERTRANGWYPVMVDSYNNLSPEAQAAVDFMWFYWRRQLGRPWWKHPRWHIHHWQIQLPWVQTLQRFLFSRCAGCGKRLPWGYTPIASGWGGEGPRWFKGEEGIFHHQCYAERTKAALAAKADSPHA